MNHNDDVQVGDWLIFFAILVIGGSVAAYMWFH